MHHIQRKKGEAEKREAPFLYLPVGIERVLYFWSRGGRRSPTSPYIEKKVSFPAVHNFIYAVASEV